MIPSPGINALLRRYRSGDVTPQRYIQDIYDRIEQCHDGTLWSYLVPLEDTLQRVTDLTQEFSKSLPLYGIPFAIDDPIDWGCTNRSQSEWTNSSDRSAKTVKNLLAAGAIPLGKTQAKLVRFEFVNFALGQETSGLRSAIFALTESDIEIVLKSAGQSPSLLV